MNLLPARALAMGIFCAGFLVASVPLSVSAADDYTAMLQANQAFDKAVAKSGRAPLAKLLRADFTWTNKDGKTLTRAQVLRDVPKPMITMTNRESDQSTQTPPSAAAAFSELKKVHTYGDVGIVQELNGREHVLRVWIKRPGGWQALVYQEVELLGPPAASSASDSSNKDCENPCRTVPFKPKNEAERAVITAYQNVEKAVTAHDSAAWGANIADDFFAVTSNSDGPLDKATRMAGLDHQTTAGIAPFPLASARMFQFGDTMVMTSLQQPDGGMPLHVTRVWIKRDGKWLELYSYQTMIQPQ